MYKPFEIKENLFYVGVNDRTKHLFENLWPLPKGVSYNSYIIDDEKVALIDTVDICYADVFFNKIGSVLGDKPIDYLVVNHMEPDHSRYLEGAGAILCRIRQLFPTGIVEHAAGQGNVRVA
jgi:anaerobic nitric oxide reductase flavorubredoxin